VPVAADWSLNNRGHRCCHPIGTLVAAQSERSDYFQKSPLPLRLHSHPHRPHSASTSGVVGYGSCWCPALPLPIGIAVDGVHGVHPVAHPLNSPPRFQSGRAVISAVNCGRTLPLHPRRRSDCGYSEAAVPGPHRCRRRRHLDSPHRRVDRVLRSLSGIHRSSPSTRPLARTGDG